MDWKYDALSRINTPKTNKKLVRSSILSQGSKIDERSEMDKN